MSSRFLLTDYAHSWVADSLFVWCQTDVSCHMFLRWTMVDMRIHLREKRIRGLNVEGNPKYCFVQWLEVEQNEPGDTLTHTFDFASWGPGQCRYWHFRAEISGIPSVSNTGIITACYLEQENAMSLKHTDLVDKDPGGVIDHGVASIPVDRLVEPLNFAEFPTTPATAPTTDYEVANKKYVDDSGGVFGRYSLRTPGHLYGPTGASLNTTLAVTARRLYALPFIVGSSLPIGQIGIIVTILSAGDARLAIYGDLGVGYPGALFLDAGLVATGTLGSKTLTIDTTLAPGLWWLTVNCEATPTLQALTPAFDSVFGFFASPFMALLGPNSNNIDPTIPPPDPFPVEHELFGTGPLVFIRPDLP